MSPEFQHFRDTWIRVCLHGSRTRTTTAIVSLCASLVVSVYYMYNVQKNTGHKVPGVVQPVVVDTPKVVEEGRAEPALIMPDEKESVPVVRVALRSERPVINPPWSVLNPPVASSPEPRIHIRKLFVEPMGNHLDESLRAEISKQFKNRIQIVTVREDADATLKGLSGARDGRNDPSGFHDNATGSLSLYAKGGRIILWSGAADDREAGAEHGGETRVAQRLVKSLKGYLSTE